MPKVVLFATVARRASRVHQRGGFCSASRNHRLFGRLERRCTPEKAAGPPMVSSEGACAPYHQYRAPRYTLIPCPRRDQGPAAFSCPVPLPAGGRILLATAAAANSARSCCKTYFSPRWKSVLNAWRSSHRSLNGVRLVHHTDSFVVKPADFSGATSLAGRAWHINAWHGRRRTVVAERRIHFGRKVCRSKRCAASSVHARGCRKRRCGNCDW